VRFTPGESTVVAGVSSNFNVEVVGSDNFRNTSIDASVQITASDNNAFLFPSDGAIELNLGAGTFQARTFSAGILQLGLTGLPFPVQVANLTVLAGRLRTYQSALILVPNRLWFLR
jgi:hypothetical protein